MSSYTIESNEDTFKDTVFKSLHHEARISISDMTLLAGFLMLWIKRCVVSTLPHEVLVADVVYLAVLLAYGRPLSMLTAMVSCLQSGLRVLTKNFCHMEALEDDEGRAISTKMANPG